MKKLSLLLLLILVLFVSCGEYNTVMKYGDTDYKYEVAKAYYARGKYTRASELLNSVIIGLKGSPYGEESLYLMAMSNFLNKDYEVASTAFKKYYQSYPRGIYVKKHVITALWRYTTVSPIRAWIKARPAWPSTSCRVFWIIIPLRASRSRRKR